MRFLKDMIRWQTLSGVTFHSGDHAVTPLARALTIRFRYGLLIWNSPVALLVEKDGERERIPIRDATRIVVLGLFGVSIAIFLASVVLGTRRKKGVEHG